MIWQVGLSIKLNVLSLKSKERTATSHAYSTFYCSAEEKATPVTISDSLVPCSRHQSYGQSPQEMGFFNFSYCRLTRLPYAFYPCVTLYPPCWQRFSCTPDHPAHGTALAVSGPGIFFSFHPTYGDAAAKLLGRVAVSCTG